MLNTDLKNFIAEKVEELLRSIAIYDSELSQGEINFILHVDGAEAWSWANIVNNNRMGDVEIPQSLIRNMSV